MGPGRCSADISHLFESLISGENSLCVMSSAREILSENIDGQMPALARDVRTGLFLD